MALAIGTSNTATTFAATQTSRESAQDIAQLVLTLDRDTYVEGSPILLSIGIKNISDDGIGFPMHPPWQVTVLTVKDGSGKIVQPSGNAASEGPGRMMNIRVAPGETFTLRRDFRDGPRQQFYPLQNWGYDDLPPGTYSVSAVEGELLYFPFSENPSKNQNPAIVWPRKGEDASNVVSFTVTKS